MALCTVAFTLCAGHVHGVHHPTNVLPQSWQVAHGPSMAISLCRQCSANQAIASEGVGEIMLAGDCPDVLVHVAGLV